MTTKELQLNVLLFMADNVNNDNDIKANLLSLIYDMRDAVLLVCVDSYSVVQKNFYSLFGMYSPSKLQSAINKFQPPMTVKALYANDLPYSKWRYDDKPIIKIRCQNYNNEYDVIVKGDTYCLDGNTVLTK